MTGPSITDLDRMAGKTVNRANANSMLVGLATRPLGSAQRLAMFCAQTLHESCGLQFASELWGPTPAQRRYEGRVDLGNTEPGDGYRFRGRTMGQITGRANYRAFTAWCRKNIRPSAPDFEASPELILNDPWAGLAPIWFWETHGLSAYADAGNIEMVTRRINGGLNGYADRINCYVRASLVLLGRDPGDVLGFQRAEGLVADGIAGPATRGALHAALGRISTPQPAPAPAPASAPRSGLFAAIAAVLAAIFGRKKA